MIQIKQKLIKTQKTAQIIQSPKFIALILGLFLFNPNITWGSFQSVEINEINYTGYTVWADDTKTDADDEFIELKNPNPSTPLILDGWTLRILSGSSSTSDKTIALSGSITDYVVIRRITNSPISLPPVDKVINVKSTDFGSLNNNLGAYIELRNDKGITIDSVNFRNKWPFTTNNTQSLHKVNNLTWEVKSHSPLNISPTPTPTPEPEKIIYGGVIISEIYPDPAVGLKEFVELYNTTDKDIDLKNWKLDDIPDTSSSTIQTLTGIIPAKGFMLLESGAELKIGLNNDQDSVILYDPDGKIQSQVDYKNPPKGSSYMWIDNNWLWNTIPSPKAVNIAPVVSPSPIIVNPITPNPIITPIIQLPKYDIGSVILSEIYPYPNLGEEFIELYNNTEQNIDLTGWKLSDLAKSYTLSGIIPAKGYKVYNQSETKIALNNTSETITLTDNYNKIQSNTSYTKAYKGLSFIPILQTWSWTQTITPNTTNIFTENTKLENSKNYIKIENVDNLAQIEDGEYIEIEGQVIIPAGELIDNGFYISKDNRIVKVYDKQKRFPNIKTGDIIKVQAEWHNTDTQQYLKTNSLDNIQIISTQTFNIQTENIAKLENTDWGKIVKISGILDSNTKTKLVIINKKQSIPVKLYADKIAKPKMKKGDTISISGFIEIYDGEIRLIPWNTAQIQVIPAVKIQSKSKIAGQSIVATDTNNTNTNLDSNQIEYRSLDEYTLPINDSQNLTQNITWYNRLWQFILDYKYFSTAIVLNLIWWGYLGILSYRQINSQY
jgi:hypothetical protein